LTPLFLIAAFFCVAAPVYWHKVEIRAGYPAEAYENIELYQRIYPEFHYGFGRLRAGDVPLWNPRQLCGTPFLANPRVGLFQPLHVLFLAWPTEQALALHAYLSLVFMGAGLALFVRSLGAGYAASLLGGVAYAFCGASASVMSRPAAASALAWAPFVLWAVREYTRNFRPAIGAVLGLCIALLFLSGATALTCSMLGLAMPYLLLETLLPGSRPAPRFVRRCLGLMIPVAVALGVAAVQWAPAAVWLTSLAQPTRALFALEVGGQAPSLSLDVLEQLLAASPGTLPRLGYIGIATILFIPAAFFRKERQRDVVFFLMAGVACWLAGLLATRTLPWDFPREAFFPPAVLCMAVLAALGMDRLTAPRRIHNPASVWAPTVTVLVLSAAVFLATAWSARGLVICTVLALVPVCIVRSRWLSAICTTAIALLLFVDLRAANANAYRHPFQDAPKCYEQYATAINRAEEYALDARAVIACRRRSIGLHPNLGMVAPLAVVGGAYLPLTKDQAAWWRQLGETDGTHFAAQGVSTVAADAARPELLNLMAARVMLAEPEAPLDPDAWRDRSPRFRVRNVEDNVRLAVNDDALPRAYWVPRARRVGNVAEAIDALGDPDFKPNEECVVTGEVPAALRGERESVFTRSDAVCGIETAAAERVVVRVEAPAAGVTVLSDSFAPEWTALLDGTPCPIMKVNGVFRGVATPAGKHEIVFEYKPITFAAGLLTTIAALALLTFAGVICLLRGH